MISGAICSLYFHASMNTNMSSAAMPHTRKMAMTCRYPKNPTLKIPEVIKAVRGKLKNMIETPTRARTEFFK